VTFLPLRCPWTQRFTGACLGIACDNEMDPIADQFPHVSVYKYAENRPIDGIDLWGLHYADFSKSYNSNAFGITLLHPTKFQAYLEAHGRTHPSTLIPGIKVDFH
jgi:hypothetical protein